MIKKIKTFFIVTGASVIVRVQAMFKKLFAKKPEIDDMNHKVKKVFPPMIWWASRRIRKKVETSDMYRIAEKGGEIDGEFELLGNVIDVDMDKVPIIPLGLMTQWIDHMATNAKMSVDRYIVSALINEREDDAVRSELDFKHAIDHKQINKIYKAAEKVMPPIKGVQTWEEKDGTTVTHDYEYYYVAVAKCRLKHIESTHNIKWEYRIEYKDYIDRPLLNKELGRVRCLGENKFLVFLDYLGVQDMGAVVFADEYPVKVSPLKKNVKAVFTHVPLNKQKTDWADEQTRIWWRVSLRAQGIKGRYLLLKATREGTE